MTMNSSAEATEPVLVSRSELAALGRRLLEAAGATPANASVVVDHLLEADAMGLASHGIIRLPQYLDEIAAGGIAPAAAPVVTTTEPACTAVDGCKGFGQVVGVRMVDEAVRLATEFGIACVVGRHMGHTGRIGAYAEAIALGGCVGLVVCSGPRSGHWVAPFGGLEGRLAPNPIAFACPVAEGPPLTGDFSTSVVPEGVVRSLRNRGAGTPEGALRDAAGRPTTDPAVLYREPRGALQPLGGDFGYRGTALALMVEVLAALLTGDETEDPAREGSNLAMIAIGADGAFARRAARMGAYVRSSPPIDPQHPVMLPGERELRQLANAGADFALVDRPTWAALAAAAQGLKMPEPRRS